MIGTDFIQALKDNLVLVVTIIFALVTFGLGYAYRVTKRPMFPASETWKAVVIGDFFTDLGMAAAIYVFTRSPWLCLIPFTAHFLTGVPMILFQKFKADRDSETVAVLDDTWGER